MYGMIKNNEFNISNEKKKGYKEIIFTEQPITDEYSFYSPFYVDDGKNIIEKWKKVKKEPTKEEIIQSQLDDINLIIADIIGGVF